MAMHTLELLEELSKKPKEEIEFALKTLMLRDQIDFLSVSNSYVLMLNAIKEDRLNRLMEAESCVHESFIYKKVKNKGNTRNDERNHAHTQRCLYLLNQSQRYNISNMNKEYHYDPEYGKQMSVYERNKKLKI